ncbi:hypothetical protein K438DRAFT_1776928 [Mycena galopus ATCC 62051]|nr:hypothetical protein K438DRAFT_1776928 [Mycena galopus ATCC 62051]
MTKVFPFVAFLFTLAAVAGAQSVTTTSSSATASSTGTDCIPKYCQCGGIGWTGGQYAGCSACVPDTECIVNNALREGVPHPFAHNPFDICVPSFRCSTIFSTQYRIADFHALG